MKSDSIETYALALRKEAPWLADMLEALHAQYALATDRHLPLTANLLRATILALLFEAGISDTAWLTP